MRPALPSALVVAALLLSGCAGKNDQPRPLADLYVIFTELYVTDKEPDVGQAVTLSAVVHNTGQIPAEGSRANFKIIRPDNETTDLGKTAAQTIPVQGNATFTMAYTPPLLGAYTVLVEAYTDSPQVDPEPPLSAQPGLFTAIRADVTAQDTQFAPSTVTVGHGSAVSWKVRNRDAVLHNLNQTTDLHVNRDLAPGRVATVNFTAPAAPGDYAAGCRYHPTMRLIVHVT